MEIDVSKLYLCSYGQKVFDLPVVNYSDYEKLHKQHQQYKQLCEQKTVDNFDLMSQIDKLKAEKKKLEQFLENILEMAKYNYKNTCLATLHNCAKCVENDKCGKQNPFTRLDFIREMIEEYRI